MPSLLAITASPRGPQSVSNNMVELFKQTWQQAHAGGTVVERDLYKTELPFVSPPWIAAAYTPAEQHDETMRQAIAISDTLVAELLAADHIVIATPMYNFNVPAILKAWIDHIVRPNLTFTMQYEGLVKGKKVTVLQSSGGSYTPGSHMETMNLETPYLNVVLSFIGMKDVNTVLLGGSNDVNQGKITLEAFLETLKPAVEVAARA